MLNKTIVGHLAKDNPIMPINLFIIHFLAAVLISFEANVPHSNSRIVKIGKMNQSLMCWKTVCDVGWKTWNRSSHFALFNFWFLSLTAEAVKGEWCLNGAKVGPLENSFCPFGKVKLTAYCVGLKKRVFTSLQVLLNWQTYCPEYLVKWLLLTPEVCSSNLSSAKTFPIFWRIFCCLCFLPTPAYFKRGHLGTNAICSWRSLNIKHHPQIKYKKCLPTLMFQNIVICP